MEIVISTVHILSSLLLIGLILLQQGKGADVGATLGGDSSSLFGPTADNPLRKVTTGVAILFMVTSVTLAYYSRFGGRGETTLFGSSTPAASTAPAVPATTPVVPTTAENASEPAPAANTSSEAQPAPAEQAPANENTQTPLANQGESQVSTTAKEPPAEQVAQ